MVPQQYFLFPGSLNLVPMSYKSQKRFEIFVTITRFWFGTIPRFRNHYEIFGTIPRDSKPFRISELFRNSKPLRNSEPFRISEFFYEWRAIGSYYIKWGQNKIFYLYYIRRGLPQFPGNHLHLQKNLFTLTCKNLGSYVQGSTVEKMWTW